MLGLDGMLPPMLSARTEAEAEVRTINAAASAAREVACMGTPLDGCSIPPHVSARKGVQRFKGRRKRANALAATRMRRLLILLALLLVPALAQARGIEPQLVAE